MLVLRANATLLFDAGSGPKARFGPSHRSPATGRILYLTDDIELIRRQLGGEVLAYDPARALLDNISTDELTPGWVCYYYDETLARYCLVGLRGGAIDRDAIKNGGFQVVVSGLSKGCGSSRKPRRTRSSGPASRS